MPRDYKLEHATSDYNPTAPAPKRGGHRNAETDRLRAVLAAVILQDVKLDRSPSRNIGTPKNTRPPCEACGRRQPCNC